MTRAQEAIKRYLQTQFTAVRYTPEGTDRVRVTDYTGKSMVFSMNIFCDILDARTKQVIAESDLPHDLSKIGTTMPKSWKNLPAYFG